MTAPAGFWRRYAAYSADLGLLLPLWLLLAWPRLQAAETQLQQDLAQVQLRLLALMEDALQQLQAPLTLLAQWAQDPPLRAALETMAEHLLRTSLQLTGLLVALAACYFIAFEASPWQASPGKRLLGLRVQSVAGGPAQLPALLLRFAGGGLSWATLNLGHALAAWTPDKTALHDWLSATRVRRSDDRPWPLWARLWLGLQGLAALCGLGWLGWRYWLTLQLLAGGLG